MNKLRRALTVLLCSTVLLVGCAKDNAEPVAVDDSSASVETVPAVTEPVEEAEVEDAPSVDMEIDEEDKAEIMAEIEAAEESEESKEADEKKTDEAAEEAEKTDESEAEKAEESEKPAEEKPKESEKQEDEALPDSAEKIEEPESKITAYSDEEDGEAEKNAADGKTSDKAKTAEADKAKDGNAKAETKASEPERIYSYLNGRTVTEEVRNRRPVAIMLNNIKKCLPQASLCDGDIYYECAAEGGITRIMMVCEDYENLGTVGSVRSSRDYFVDFLANHDAIYVHAGGSEQAYAKINWRGINNLDGVNMYIPNMFWRDQTRMNTMGYEHSLMTSGKGIAAGISYKKYRTELSETQVPLFEFYDEKTDNKLVGSPATHIHMKSTSIQTVDFVYDEKTGEYLRYQYNGIAQTDANTGEQLSVKNVLILFTDISLIPGDTAGRLQVGTVGSGQGYYITNGKRKVVNWSREGKTDTLHLEYKNGDKLILNCGKTFICVVDNSVAKGIEFEYKW